MMLWFVHGWGFDSSVWNPLVAQLPDYAAAFHDRSYFGTPAAPLPEEPLIAVTHSLGTMLALRELPPQCRGIVAINGFDCFAARDDFAGVPRRVVERMVKRLDEDAPTVLSEFRFRCGDDTPFDVLALDLNALRDDLNLLLQGDFRAEAAALTVPLLSLQGGIDPILPLSLREEAFASVPVLERRLHPTAGHLLPRTDASFCAGPITRFAEQLS